MRNYSRLFVSFAFTWAQIFALAPVQAASPSEMKQMKEFFAQTGVTQKNVKLKDLYEKTKAALPQDLRFEIELYLEMNPRATLPKIEIKTVKNGTKEDLQLSFTEKGQSGSFLLSLKNGEVGRLTYSLKGKTYDKSMKFKDTVYPVRFLTALAGPGYARSEKVGFSQLFSGQQLAALKVEDRNRYQNHIRELLEAAEKVQQKHKKVTGNARKERKTSMLESLVAGQLAWAETAAAATSEKPKDGSTCLTMGWSGSYKAGVCEPPKEAYKGNLLSGKCFVCNPAVYGREMCGKTQIEAGSESTISVCNAKLKEFEKNKAPTDGSVASIEALKKKMEDGRTQNEALTVEINKLLLLCQTEGLQDKECKDLRERVAQLRRDNCAFIDENPTLAGDMKCYFDPNDPIQVAKAKADAEKAAAAASTTTVAKPGAGTDGTPSGKNETVISKVSDTAPPNPTPADNREVVPRTGEDRDYSVCAGLPVDPSGLGCNQEQVRETKCNVGGELRTFYYCQCSRDSNARPTACDRGGYVGSDSGAYERSSGGYQSSRRPAPQKSWWEQGTSSNFLGPMLGLLGSLGMIWLSHYQMKQQLAAQYNMLQPQVLQVAPPAAALMPTVSTGGAPVIQGR